MLLSNTVSLICVPQRVLTYKVYFTENVIVSFMLFLGVILQNYKILPFEGHQSWYFSFQTVNRTRS